MVATVPGAPGPAPRRFPLRALDTAAGFLILFGGIWALVGSIVSVAFTVTGGPLWNDLILDRRGVTAQALPTSVEPTGIRLDHRRVFRVHYTFRDAAGATRLSSAGSINARVIAEARQQLPMTIEYDPRQPERSRVRGERASPLGLLVLIPVGFLLIGTLVLAFGLRRARRQRRIYVHGAPAQATVTATSATQMRINGRRVMRIDYVFDSIMGPAAGRTTSRNPPPVGAKIWVLYDEGDPKISVAA
jgi:hypothetical protein